MPGKGKVRMHNLPTDETILAPGYREIWVCLLLADQTVLPLTRRLWSENGPDRASMNLAEVAEIRRAADIVREAFKLDVILVADSGYRREKSKKVLLSDGSARQVTVRTESEEKVSFNVLCLTPDKEGPGPMYLATTLTTETRQGGTARTRGLMERLEETLRLRFARPKEEMTLGRFMRLIALDFPGPRLAGLAL
ncbi:MAG: hypothetical protein Q8T11_06480 [Elusimicrobiota bacterium]|nr:hypothetical protein [Elusimicrobiota bacterium]